MSSSLINIRQTKSKKRERQGNDEKKSRDDEKKSQVKKQKRTQTCKCCGKTGYMQIYYIYI